MGTVIGNAGEGEYDRAERKEEEKWGPGERQEIRDGRKRRGAGEGRGDRRKGRKEDGKWEVSEGG